jgi:hypothetical protein
MLFRSLSAAFQSFSSKPRFAPLELFSLTITTTPTQHQRKGRFNLRILLAKFFFKKFHPNNEVIQVTKLI